MTTTIRPSSDKFFYCEDGPQAFLSAEREHDTGDIIIHAPRPIRITAEVLHDYVAWLGTQMGPKAQ